MSKIKRVVKTGPVLPKPRDLEAKTDFVRRFVIDPYVIVTYPTKVKRLLSAERAWAKAKAESLVSVTTSLDQFLLFN